MEGIRRKIDKMLGQEPLNKRGYKFVGMGSDKVVLETPGSSRKLIKVSQDVLRQKISNLLMNEDYSPTTPESKNHDVQRGKIAEIEEDEREIREIFGEDHFLKTGVFRIKIPITKEFLVSLFGDNQKVKVIDELPDDFESEIEMLAETQIIAEELRDPEKYSTNDLSTELISHKTFFKQDNIDKALEMARSFIDEGLVEKFEKMFQDEDYKRVIRDIVSKIIEYTKKTGLMIDVFGLNNITIFKKEDGSVGYHIIEALMPAPKEVWVMNISQDSTLKRLRHYYVYYYFIRSLADMVGIEDNIKPDDLVYFKDATIPMGDWPPKNL